MVDILNLEKTKISRNLKGKMILLYGSAKAGKTTLLSTLPKCLIIATEIGYNALDNAYVQYVSKWTDFKSIIKQLKNPLAQEKYEFIGIDTADFLYEICEKFICIQNGVEKLGDIPYGQGYALCKREFSDSLREIAALGYGLCFTSHSAEKTFKNEKGEDYIRIVPALPQRPYDVVNKMVDVIGYLRAVKNYDTGEERNRLFFRGDDRFLAGSRFKYMVPYMDYNFMESGSEIYDKLAGAFYDAIEKQADANGTEILENGANLYQEPKTRSFEEAMEEARQLWVKIATDETKATKVLSIVEKIFGKPMKISEATEAQQDLLELVIEELKEM